MDKGDGGAKLGDSTTRGGGVIGSSGVDTETPAAGLRVLVVDGDAELLAASLKETTEIVEVYTAADAMGALRLLRSVDIDAIFAGIDLPGHDGLELARILRRFAKPPSVAFFASNGRRAAEAFEVGAVDYLLRPVNAARLTESLQRISAVSRRMAQPARLSAAAASPAGRPAADEQILVTLGGVTTRVARSSVRWMEAHHGYTRLHTANGSHTVAASLVNLSSKWIDDGFIQIHRAYAVRMAAVSELRKVGGQLTVVVDGQELPVSRRYARRVRPLLFAGKRIRTLIPHQPARAEMVAA